MVIEQVFFSKLARGGLEKSCTKILGCRGIDVKLLGDRHAALDERCGFGGGKTISIIKS